MVTSCHTCAISGQLASWSQKTCTHPCHVDPAHTARHPSLFSGRGLHGLGGDLDGLVMKWRLREKWIADALTCSELLRTPLATGIPWLRPSFPRSTPLKFYVLSPLHLPHPLHLCSPPQCIRTSMTSVDSTSTSVTDLRNGCAGAGVHYIRCASRQYSQDEYVYDVGDSSPTSRTQDIHIGGGKKATSHDAETLALATASRHILHTVPLSPRSEVNIFSDSIAALKNIMDPSPHPAQVLSLIFIRPPLFIHAHSTGPNLVGLNT